MLLRRVAPTPDARRFAAGDLIEVDGRPVRLAVNARAHRISLRLDLARREVVATAPSARSLEAAVAFARTKAVWIADHVDRLPHRSALAPGMMIEILGQPCRLERAAMRITPRLIPATAHESARLIAYGANGAFARAAERGLRTHALDVLTRRSAHHCARLAIALPRLVLTDTRGRWGSCRQASAGDGAVIRYSWRLVLSPPWVLDYVVAHECAHLIEANHGPRFWNVVAQTYGDPAPARRWLKLNGARLHAIAAG